MRSVKKQTKSITVSGRIPQNIYAALQEYTEENDMSMSELVQIALGFFMYCLDEEEEDSDVKDVLDKYFDVDEDDEDEDDDEEDEDDEETSDDDEATDEDE